MNPYAQPTFQQGLGGSRQLWQNRIPEEAQAPERGAYGTNLAPPAMNDLHWRDQIAQLVSPISGAASSMIGNNPYADMGDVAGELALLPLGLAGRGLRAVGRAAKPVKRAVQNYRWNPKQPILSGDEEADFFASLYHNIPEAQRLQGLERARGRSIATPSNPARNQSQAWRDASQVSHDAALSDVQQRYGGHAPWTLEALREAGRL